MTKNGHRRTGLARVILTPGFWLIVLLLLLITLPHYAETLPQPSFISQFTVRIGLTRHTFERVLYMAPIIWAGFLFGYPGAAITAVAAFLLMLPRGFFLSPQPLEALMESAAVFVLGSVVALSFDALRKERERRRQLELAQRELEAHVKLLKENEKRLAALNQTASAVSQSLDLNYILSSSLDCVAEALQVEAALLFLLDESTSELRLAGWKGVSEQFVKSVGPLRLGEGLNGAVARSGQPLFVDDASSDPRLTKMAVQQEKLRSELIVPLMSKGKVMGTLCAAVRCYRSFRKDEVELLSAIGNQIGVAVENARLYQQQREFAARLKASEERYRDLFESAQDAIWVHDLEGRIVVANRAAEKLTGYTVEELAGKQVTDFLSKEAHAVAREVGHKLLEKQPVAQPYEQRLVRKDGSEAVLMLTTSLVSQGGRPTAFQHIARDVTEEKRMQENLRYYLGQITRAQEEERKRIARELHDGTIQDLVVLARQIDDLTSPNSGLAEDKRLVLEKLYQQTDSMIQEVRRLSQDLRPAILDRLGLLPALEWQASRVTEFSRIVTTVKVSGMQRRLPEELELVLFRIAQETLRNVWRHSGATSADVSLDFGEDKVRLAISDNGKGFDLPQALGDLARGGRLGLAGMQERARLIGGAFDIKSAPGQGTTVTVEVPVPR